MGVMGRKLTGAGEDEGKRVLGTFGVHRYSVLVVLGRDLRGIYASTVGKYI